MRFLFLIHADEAEMKTWPEEEALRCVREGMKYDEVLKEKGHFVASHGLEWASQATVLRKQSGKVVSTDGPFAETKEQLLGFYVIDCASLEEAIEAARLLLAPRVAAGLMSALEIRPISVFQPGRGGT
jgi:hypothetical protein